MDYRVIARRWRPRRFDQVVGQEHIIGTLTHAIERNRIAHAYLFSGSRGTGKTTMARLFAMALNAREKQTANFDPEDPICAAIWRGTNLDVLEIDGASNNSVDEVRALRERCIYAPAECRYRIFIIDEVHMLTNAAFNALLKILEEPPEHVKFIFATTDAQKVLSTVVSRCQRFNFRPIPQDLMKKRLEEIADAEGVTIESGAIGAIVRMAGGGMRDAQSLLEQMIAFCGKNICTRDVLSMFSLVDEVEVKAMADSLIGRNGKYALALAENWNKLGVDFYHAFADVEEELQRRLVSAVENNSTDRAIIVSLLHTLCGYERQLQFAVSPGTTFAVALLLAIENSHRRPIEEIMRALKCTEKDN
ncbi:MAG: DNA polymerase III subunit gamma/tau [Puniceicoccales bacterium]|jgi:DNA polymerase-3 subunit gamma/tau|nr:DNA polymerase III subunit gamma/tau [Puniceicoccales bacterium]